MSETVKQILNRFQSDAYMGRQGKVYTDTSDFMRITGGDVIVFKDGHYLVLRDEVERSYGIEDPKYWVKRCRHLESGERRLLLYIVGKGFYSQNDIITLFGDQKKAPEIEQGDFLLMFKNRLANLRKIFPYIPEELNRVLMHFSAGPVIFCMWQKKRISAQWLSAAGGYPKPRSSCSAVCPTRLFIREKTAPSGLCNNVNYPEPIPHARFGERGEADNDDPASPNNFWRTG